jgi:Fe-S oxidoreductase
MSTFKRHEIKRIITCCPHCFNILKNEYFQLGANFTVVFYTELLAELIKGGKLKIPREIEKTITYHDPCYQVRYNGFHKSPRDILKFIPKATVREMDHSRNKSFCCGAGGGHLWLEEKGERINEIRIAEAMEVRPDILATSCPFCLIMLDDGVKSIQVQDLVQVMDIAELISVSD